MKNAAKGNVAVRIISSLNKQSFWRRASEMEVANPEFLSTSSWPFRPQKRLDKAPFGPIPTPRVLLEVRLALFTGRMLTDGREANIIE